MTYRPHSPTDTIVALASAPGEGAVAIVRLSGPEAVRIGRDLAPVRGERRSHQLYLTSVRSRGGSVLDQGMVVEMLAPRSYTGEDIVEFHLHGARTVTQAVIEECIGAGARLAGPGEYTLRAFLNGKVDLAQAEAVGDLIMARGDCQREVATSQLQGGLSRKILGLQEDLEGVLADFQAALDFPEQPTGDGLEKSHHSTVSGVADQIDGLVGGARLDLHRGRRIALCGAPNVGKSSLLNAWLGEERVLVDADPGTTRDPVEVPLQDGLIHWSLVDTAGIRGGAAGLEKRGIDMTLAQMEKADVQLWLVDPRVPVWPQPGLKALAVGSKADLADESFRRQVEVGARERHLEFLGWVSCISGEGLEALREKLSERFSPAVGETESLVVRHRHMGALKDARGALERFFEASSAGFSLDILAIELEEAVRSLGYILGRDVDAAMLDRIFSEFCIGK